MCHWIDLCNGPSSLSVLPLSTPCSAAPRLMFKGVEVPEHSLVVREAIGEANTDTLMCVTDYRPCCANDTGSTWIYGNTVSHYMSRGDGVVRLHQTPDAAGIVACRIRITDGDSESAYQLLLVGVYPHTSSISAPEDGEYICSYIAIAKGQFHNYALRLYTRLITEQVHPL